MSINLLNMVKDVAGDALMKQASGFLGVDESSTKGAFGAILPSLMAGMIDKGATEEGATSLLNFINTNNHDGGILDKIGDLLGGGATTDGLMSSGAGVLKFLVGNKLAGLTDLIADISGLKPGNTSSLLKMLSPILMGVVGKYIKNKALDSGGLKSLLLGQRSHVKEVLPAGVGKLLGLTAFSDITEKVADTLSEVSETTAEAASTTASQATQSGNSKLLPWILGILAILAAIFLLRRGCSGTAAGDAVDSAVEQVETTAQEAGESVRDAASDLSDAIRSITLPGGAEIRASAGSFLDQLAQFISGGENDPSRAFTFDNVNFETGSDQITAESQAQLDDLASILKAYSKVNIRVEGHTDNTGDPATNKTISEDRAKSVKAFLVGQGVPGSRIETAGFGDQKPIATNDTEEGRTQNRRVEVYVTGK